MCKCLNCNHTEEVYFKDKENDEYYPYRPTTIMFCTKHDKFIIPKKQGDTIE